jgi:murein L,D-transpeptidase YafK
MCIGRAIRRILFAFLTVVSFTVLATEKSDRVVVDKTAKTLSLYKSTDLIASFPVVFGPQSVGHKQQEGDGRTPEGSYLLDFKKSDSAFYKALHISYPNPKDVEAAKLRGVHPGGSVMVHGQKNYLGWAWFATKHFNWTNGCIALSNKDMDIVWESVDAGTSIEIKP